MKLIDLLVKELPKRGGWPECADRCRVDNLDSDSITVSFCFTEGYSNGFDVPFQLSMTLPSPDHNVSVATRYCMITRDLYESTLSASQKPAWDGEGLPPVGMHCEIVDPDGVLMYGQGESGEVISHVENTAVIRMSYGLGCFEARFLRPLRTEAKRKRDAAIEAMNGLWNINSKMHCESIYDAIAAGKIPGVKLDD